MDIDLILIGAAVAAVLLLAVFIAIVVRRSRSSKLRNEFGPEYDNAVRSTKSRTKGEADLVARKERARDYTIRPLTPTERDHFHAEWPRIESRFLDRPTTAVVEAEELIADVMRRCGYPIGNFEQRAGELSVDHPALAHEYRAAHEMLDKHKGGGSATEELRQALVRLRGVFEGLLGEPVRPVRRDLGLLADTEADDGGFGPAAERQHSDRGDTDVPIIREDERNR